MGTYDYDVYVLAVGDFNGDGKPDLVLNGAGGLNLLEGNGDGTFGAPINFAQIDGTRAVARDLNEDGKLDLVVTGQDAYGGVVTVFLGNGDGTFLPGVSYATGGYAYGLAIGDVNGDGKLDLVATDLGTYPAYADGAVSVLLGNGDGTFGAAANYAAGTYPTTVAIGNFGGDGKLDLVVNQGASNTYNLATSVVVLLGDGDGTFRRRSPMPSAPSRRTTWR